MEEKKNADPLAGSIVTGETDHKKPTEVVLDVMEED